LTLPLVVPAGEALSFALVDHLHQQGIGVFMDWVPSHFPTDGHGLARFDGTHLYEHADPRRIIFMFQ
jgi:1,4-alpha-glucan branching enzyme